MLIHAGLNGRVSVPTEKRFIIHRQGQAVAGASLSALEMHE